MRQLYSRLDNVGLDTPGRPMSVEIDWTEIQGPIVLFAGPNGSGKSTTMAIWCLAVFGEHPDYGKMLGLVAVDGGPGTAQSRFEHGGHVYDWTRTLAKSRKADGNEEAARPVVIVLRDDEEYCSGARECDALAAELFGDFAEWSTIFVQRQRTAEGSGKTQSFTSTKTDARRQFIEACLGISHHSAQADAAGARALAAKRSLEALTPDYERLVAARERRTEQAVVVESAEAAAIVAQDTYTAAQRAAARTTAALDGLAARQREAERIAAARTEAEAARGRATLAAAAMTAAAETSAARRAEMDAAIAAHVEASRNVEAAKLAAADVASAQERRRDAADADDKARRSMVSAEAAEREARAAVESARTTAAAAERLATERAARLDALATAAAEKASDRDRLREELDAVGAEHKAAIAHKEALQAVVEQEGTALRAALADRGADRSARAAATKAAERHATVTRESEVAAAGDVRRAREAIERAEKDAGGIDCVPCHAEGACADCGFLSGAVAQRAALPGLRDQLAVAVATHEAVQARVAVAAGAVREAEEAERAAHQLEADARVALETDTAAKAAVREQDGVVAAIVARGKPVQDQWLAARTVAEQAAQAHAAAQAEQLPAHDASALPRAEERLRGAVENATQARAAADATAARLAALPPADATEDERLRAVAETEATAAHAAAAETAARAAASAASEASAARRAEADMARAGVEAAEAAVAELPEPNAPSAEETAEAEAEHATALTAEGEAIATVTTTTREAAEARGALAQLERDIVALEPKAVARDAAGTEVRRWAWLQSLLKDLIARKIEASAGEINDLVNTQLRQMWGARLSVDFQALRRNRTVDTYEAAYTIFLVDHETGNRREFDGWSGGQQTPAGLALRNGLVKFYNRHCHRLGRSPFLTLFVDEFDAALSEDAKPEFQRMLREFAADAGLDKICVISHTPGFDADSTLNPREHMRPLDVVQPKKRRTRTKAEKSAESESWADTSGDADGETPAPVDIAAQTELLF